MNKLIDETTENLMQVLQGAGPGEVASYLKERFAEGAPTFVQYMDALLEEKGLKRQQVLLRAELPEKYGYKLLTGERHTNDRDKLLRLCLAMELDLKQTQRALRLYGMSELYPKLPRDVVLISAICRRCFDLEAVNLLLIRAGFEPLYRPEP